MFIHVHMGVVESHFCAMYVFLRKDAPVEVLDKFLWMIFFTQLHVVDNGIVESDKYYIIGFLGKYNILLKKKEM